MIERRTCQIGPRLSPGTAAPEVLAPAVPPAWPELSWTYVTWKVAAGGRHGTRPALEVYISSTLVDVLVATHLTRGVLGGGCRYARRGRQLAVAWGHLFASSPPLLVFRSHGPFHRSDPGVLAIAGRGFWIAMAEGAFTSVTVSHSGGTEFRRLRRIAP